MKSIYIVFTHSLKPNFDRMGKKTTDWESYENVEFVDRLKDDHLTGATAIVDYLHEKMVKCRDNDITYEAIIEHANKTYPDHMAQLDQMILSLSEQLVDTTEEAAPQDEEEEGSA